MLERLLAQARYDLRLTPAEFYRLTPRQFHLLTERHREALAHSELVAGWTTAAVKNFSFCPPEKPASPLDTMPSYRGAAERAPELTEEEQDRQTDFNIRVLELAARQKAQEAARGA